MDASDRISAYYRQRADQTWAKAAAAPNDEVRQQYRALAEQYEARSRVGDREEPQ